MLSFVTRDMLAFITEEKKHGRNVNTAFLFLTYPESFLKENRYSMVVFNNFITRLKTSDKFPE